MKKLIILISLSSSLLAQGPVDGYMKNKQDFSAGISISREKGKQLYAGTSPITFSRSTMAYSIFGIYGITNKINVQLNVPYINVEKGQEKGFQDFSLYLKFQLLKKENKKGNINLLLATGLAHPLTDYSTSSAFAIGQQATSIDGRLVVQQNFNNKFFLAVQGGYFVKSNPTPHSYSSAIKFGYAGKVYADIWFETLQAIGGTDYRGTGDKAVTTARGGFQGLGFSYNKVGGTVFYPFTKHIGAFGGLSYVLNGRNAFKNTGINVGIVFQ